MIPSKTPAEISEQLRMPFEAKDIEWRIQWSNKEKTYGLVVPYVTNRAIQNRLDDVVGMENWHNVFEPWHSEGTTPGQLCGISIHFESHGWVTKYDGAADSNIESLKGGLSDSMKRAAVQWGIGRFLYDMDAIRINLEMSGNRPIIPKQERAILDQRYNEMIRGRASTNVIPLSQGQTTPIDYQYQVTNMTIQQGGASTMVTLQDKAGTSFPAYYNGPMPDVQMGTYLTNVKYHTQVQQSVVFQVLERYTVVGTACAA